MLWVLLVGASLAQDLENGERLAGLGGCASCHTADDGARYAGGHAIETSFGTFYGTNLTPDPEHGIGAWTEADFVRAMREGRSPEGKPYWPAFPYGSFTRMTDHDLRDLFAWLQTLPADPRPDESHRLELRSFGRLGLSVWRGAAFEPGAYEEDPDASAEWNRGAYLVRGVGHCGECHTPRSWIGRLKARKELAGSRADPEPGPNLTPHADGLGGWSASDVADFLQFGMEPDGDFTGGGMTAVVEEGTAKLSEADRQAIVTYLQGLPAKK